MEPVRVFLCGDVMTGRGIDQVLGHPGDPALREPAMDDARDYVRLAEHRSGPIGRRLPDAAPWGEALGAIDESAPAARVINLETSVTTSGDFWPGKEVHYRMHPANVGCLAAARVDVCTLANNHVLDFGRAGLLETLATLRGAGIATAGAGATRAEALAPASVPLPGGGKLHVFSVGHASSGIPQAWAAGADLPGVALLPSLGDDAAEELGARVRAARGPGDLAIVSIHWGSNWGYDVPVSQVRFAHRLIEAGVDLVHGHSSHHPRPLEVHRGRLVLYGAGDFLDDYEGISGHEAFRGDLVLAYFATLARDGTLLDLRAAPFRLRRLRATRAAEADARWLANRLTEASAPFGTRLRLDAHGRLALG